LDKYDFAEQPPIDRNRIYVSWNEQWELSRYVDAYLQERGLRNDSGAKARVLKAIDDCPAHGSLRKADVDYWLDCHVKQELSVPQPVQLTKKAK
jgi:hypothetical protein